MISFYLGFMSTQIGFPYHLDILCFMGLFWELSCQQHLVLVRFIFCGFTFLKVFSILKPFHTQNYFELNPIQKTLSLLTRLFADFSISFLANKYLCTFKLRLCMLKKSELYTKSRQKELCCYLLYFGHPRRTA